MNTFYILPRQGRRVIDPATGLPLPAEGARVEKTQYWLRRLKEGSVTKKGA